MIHEVVMKVHVGGNKMAGHISRDFIAIEAREKPPKKKEYKEQSHKKRRGVLAKKSKFLLRY